MNAVFTIIAKNYLGLAGVLEKSVRRNSGCDFFVIIADEWEGPGTLPDHVLVGREVLDIEEGLWEKMAFQYNLVEFCTAIKPLSFRYFFDRKKYDKVIYVDPDVYFFGSPDTIFTLLEDSHIVLTPHLLRLQTELKQDYPDHLFLLNGTFNLGFLGLKSGIPARRLLDWWHARLIDQCYFDFDKGMATDQKWISLIPSFFSPRELHISLHKGMNVAPWNFDERELRSGPDGWLVMERGTEGAAEPLVFAHFSGINYGALMRGEADYVSLSKGKNDCASLIKEYADEITRSDFGKYAGLAYSYGQFNDGFVIISLQRRIFRRLTDEGLSFPKPFSTGSGSFYEKLKKAGLIDASVISADKVTNRNIKGFDSKLKYVHLFFKVLQRLLGVRRYSMMIRFLRRFFREENQAFLLDSKAGKSFQ